MFYVISARRAGMGNARAYVWPAVPSCCQPTASEAAGDGVLGDSGGRRPPAGSWTGPLLWTSGRWWVNSSISVLLYWFIFHFIEMQKETRKGIARTSLLIDI